MPQRPRSAFFMPNKNTSACAVFYAFAECNTTPTDIQCLQRKLNGEVVVTFKSIAAKEQFIHLNSLSIDSEPFNLQDIDKPLTVLTIYDAPFELSDLAIIKRPTPYCEVIHYRRGKQLDISGNQIGPNLTADIFYGFNNMSFLYLNQCGLKYIENGTFRAMRKLMKLALSGNKLSHVSAGILEGPSEKSFRLNLSDNKLTSLPDFSGILELEILIVRSNKIKQLPVDVFTQKFNVTNNLDLSGNHLDSIEEDAFSNLTVLKQMDLSYNKLRFIPDGAFSGCKLLVKLMLTGNNLTCIRKDTFAETSLELLFLQGNRIKHIEGNAFRYLNSLEILTLFANPIELLQNDTFKGVSTNVRLANMASRFKTVTLEEVTKLKEAAESLNTRKSTINWVRVFEKWCDENSFEKNLEMILLE
ncbi:Insulin-like growth factor-binding protein complex acid labile subunit [Stylophora pistillata]|uniref:Insulin-like growth factor-binding protein complex acid labile subunit n=1 Tax=Stylophora pistillata TaxID=50429 RepID=A0A2B4S057_STYPI|nr:Insulin-like growth factor-binding protein complex acid labile subunit [Stylophora pistillata]